MRFHLQDQTSVEGVYERRSRRYYHLTKGRIELNGTFEAAQGAGIVMVPRGFVSKAQVIG